MLPLYEWEYDTFETDLFRFKKISDRRGEQGGEIINVSTYADKVRVFLKRPKLFGISVK